MAVNLRTAREAAGLSQGQVAKILDLHRPTVTEIEAGRRKVSGEELARFAALYRVGVEWLAGSPDETDAAEDRNFACGPRTLENEGSGFGSVDVAPPNDPEDEGP